MRNYYYDQSNRNLVCYDDEAKAVSVLMRITNVKVFVGGDMQIGDFDADDTPPSKKGGRKCGNCGKPGHQARKCDNK